MKKISAAVWKTALILLTILLIGGFLAGIAWLIGKPIYQKKMDEFRSFRTEYVGYALSNPLNEAGDPAMIAFHGEKNGRGIFAGDVTVTVNGEKVYECLDCELRGEDGSFALITDDGWTPDLGVPRDTRIVGSIRVDGDMESFLLIPSESDGAYVAFVAPAQTHSEAYDLYFELYGTEKP